VMVTGRYVLRVEQGLVEAASGEASLAGTICLELASAMDDWAAQGFGTAALQTLQATCARELQTLKTLLRGQLHYHLGGAMLRTRQLAIETQRLLDATPPPR